MQSVLVDNVAIELLINGHRNELFEKLTRRDPPPFTSACQNMSNSQSDLIDQNKNDPSLYVVKEHYLSEDKKELVFKVINRSVELWYYAFEFDDYICCPAFLAASLKITNYAYLTVTEGTEYYYIFFEKDKKESGDTFSDFLNTGLNLCGKHHFVGSADEPKIFLNFANKDTEYLVTFPKESISDLELKLLYECRDFMDRRTTIPLKESKIAPNYFFMKNLLMDLLWKKYGMIFAKFLLSVPIVRKDSFTFREAAKLYDQIKQAKGKKVHFLN